MTLSAGMILDPYEILAPTAAGGMVMGRTGRQAAGCKVGP
jgi:hypothetical protein